MIAYVDNDVQYFGFIPVIVAKCGSFLKDQGKEEEKKPPKSIFMFFVYLIVV